VRSHDSANFNNFDIKTTNNALFHMQIPIVPILVNHARVRTCHSFQNICLELSRFSGKHLRMKCDRTVSIYLWVFTPFP
jgi:hypothetical protein